MERASVRVSAGVAGEGMVGSFACPECGAEVTPGARSPGRQVRCARCSTLVEVPFLPRVAVRRRGRSARAWRRPAAWGALALVGVALMATGVGRALRSSPRAGPEAGLDELAAGSAEAEHDGRLG